MIYSLFLFAYTIVLAVYVFQASWYVNLGFLVVHIILLAVLGVKPYKIYRTMMKLLPFLALIILTSGLFVPYGDPLIQLPLFSWVLTITKGGLRNGLTAAIGFWVIASIAMFYHVNVFEASLAQLAQRVRFLTPYYIAQKFLLSTDQLDKRGQGGGKGKGKERIQFKKKKFAVVLEKIEKTKKKLAKTLSTSDHEMDSHYLYITAIAILLFSLKVVKLLPGIPFASGQRLVVMIPLLFLAAKKGKMWSGTVTAFTYSLLVLAFGQLGHMGILDPVRMVALGLLVDLVLPFVPKRGGASFILLTIFGGGAGFIFAFFSVAWASLFEVPNIIYLFTAPRFIFNTIFGLISGSLSHYLLRHIDDFAFEEKRGKMEASRT